MQHMKQSGYHQMQSIVGFGSILWLKNEMGLHDAANKLASSNAWERGSEVLPAGNGANTSKEALRRPAHHGDAPPTCSSRSPHCRCSISSTPPAEGPSVSHI